MTVSVNELPFNLLTTHKKNIVWFFCMHKLGYQPMLTCSCTECSRLSYSGLWDKREHLFRHPRAAKVICYDPKQTRDLSPLPLFIFPASFPLPASVGSHQNKRSNSFTERYFQIYPATKVHIDLQGWMDL